MFEYLSKNEKRVLNFYKEEYDRMKINPMYSVIPKMNIKHTEDVVTLLQKKGYFLIERRDFNSNMQLVRVVFKDRFFAYFNIEDQNSSRTHSSKD